MKKMGKKFIAGTAMVLTAASLSGCSLFDNLFPNPTVYGPPPENIQETVPETDAEETFDPATEINEDVYGPPEWFE